MAEKMRKEEEKEEAQRVVAQLMGEMLGESGIFSFGILNSLGKLFLNWICDMDFPNL